MRASRLAHLALMASLAATACGAAPQPAPEPRSPVGLMTTLPLLWAEAEDVGAMLKADAEAGWVRQELETLYAIEPLDTLDEAALAPLKRLVLAQPRALSPAENVALDAWVRGGGKLLLFADPMLTRHSRYPIGDRRRPQDVVLLSPILAHWGLELLFADEPVEGERAIDLAGTTVPVDVAGSFRIGTVGAGCALAGDGVLADCRIGKGRVIALADAAVLDDPEDGPLDARRRALNRLVALAFD